MNNYEWIVFDVGGVIFNYRLFLKEFFDILVTEHKLDREFIEEAYYSKTFFWCKNDLSMTELFEGIVENSVLSVHDAINIYMKCYLKPENRVIYKDVMDLINKLRKNNYKIGIITDVQKEMIEGSNNIINPSDYDSYIASCNMNMLKEDTRIFEYFTKINNTTSDKVIFIDDSQTNVDIANSANIRGILFKNTSDLYSKLEQLGIRLN